MRFLESQGKVCPTIHFLKSISQLFHRSNLTAVPTFDPPSIPGFSTAIQYDHTKPRDEWEIYLLLIKGMKAYGSLPWEARVGANPFPFSVPGLSIRLVAHYFPPAQLVVKHVVMGLYEMSCDMVSQEPPSFFDTHATLSLLGRPIGDIQIQKRPSAGVADDLRTKLTTASSTQTNVSLIDSPQPARGGETFSYRDIEVPSFRVSGTFTGQNIALSLLFTACSNALAQVAVPDHDRKGVDINAVSAGATFFSPYASILIQDMGAIYGPERLSYNQAARAIVCLWRMFLETKKYGGLKFVIEDSGEEIGNGSLDGKVIDREGSVARLK